MLMPACVVIVAIRMGVMEAAAWSGLVVNCAFGSTVQQVLSASRRSRQAQQRKSKGDEDKVC